MPTKIKKITPEDTKAQLPVWIEAVNEMLKEHQKALNLANGWGSECEPSKVCIGNGRKYIKIWNSRGSIFAFIRAADGAILMPASRKQPALNHIRGSIFDTDVKKAVSPYGVRYMDDPALQR